MSIVEPEIRSQIIIRTIRPIDPNKAYEIVEDLVIKALDAKPIRSSHLLTRRRPNIGGIAGALQDAFRWMDNYTIFSIEDLVVIIRFDSMKCIEIGAIVTVEPVFAAGEICYWLRCNIYEGSENTSLHVGFLHVMASFFGVLDYPDAVHIDRLKYSFVSKSAIAAFARHPERTQTLFLIPKSATDTRARKIIRLKMAGALIPYGIVGELNLDGIRELTDLKLPKEVCAIALPPIGFASPNPRIVLEAPSSKNDDRLRWAGMSEYLNEIVQPDAPWLSDSYEMCPAQIAAVQYSRLITNRKDCVVVSHPFDREIADDVKSTTDQPGWDLYSPLPIKVDASEQPETVEPASIGDSLDADIRESEAVAENALDASLPEDNATAAGQIQEDEVESGYPSSLSELPIWVERRLSSALEIAPRAIRGMKKFLHPQPQRIAEALELLAGPRLALFRGDRSSAQAFHRGLAMLRLRDGFSGAERLAGRTGSDYLLSHCGKTCFLDRHLASNSSGFNDPKLIRIYYFYDPHSDKIVVGWLPTHLQTSKS